jgi:hypothetical protein
MRLSLKKKDHEDVGVCLHHEDEETCLVNALHNKTSRMLYCDLNS